MYAAKDGNVYKNTDDGWNKYGGNESWTPSSDTKPAATSSATTHPTQTKSSASAPSPETSSAAQSRSRGNTQASQWGGNRSSGGGVGVGGADRFGGGFGGGGDAGFRGRR